MTVGTRPSTATLVAAQAAAAAMRTTISGKRMVAMTETVSQADDAEIDALDVGTIKRAYDECCDRIGSLLPADEEMSDEQLMIPREAFQSGGAPRADTAVGEPRRHRVQKLRGVKIAPNGDITSTELAGPADLGDWKACYAAAVMGRIMFDRMSPAGLQERCSRQRWALLDQADVQARFERAERLRRPGEDAKVRAEAKKTDRESNPDVPGARE